MTHDRYEATDANPRLVVTLALGIGFFLIAAPLALSLFYVFPRRDDLAAGELPAAPRLQIAPRDDLAKLHAAEDRELGTYGWTDRGNGVVRLPIARAMELTAQRGIAGWNEVRPESQIPPRAGVGR